MSEPKPAGRVPEVVNAFREEGYKILFADPPTSIPPREIQDRRLQPDVIRLKPGQSPPDAPIEHRPPRVPMFVDGKAIEGGEISQFNGQPLYYAVDEVGDYGSRLHAFTSEEEANEFVIDQVSRAERSDKDPNAFFGSHVLPSYPVHFYEHVGFQGSHTQLDYRHAFWDLTQHHMSGILWWWTSWNDQVSSLITTGRGVKLYEHIHWGGSWLYFPSNRAIWSLVDYGWNDRVSSVETTY